MARMDGAELGDRPGFEEGTPGVYPVTARELVQILERQDPDAAVVFHQGRPPRSGITPIVRVRALAGERSSAPSSIVVLSGEKL
jgi:hypothetical protein